MAGRCDEVGECDWRESALAGGAVGALGLLAGVVGVAAAPAGLSSGDAPAAVLAAGSHATLLPPRGRSGRNRDAKCLQHRAPHLT